MTNVRRQTELLGTDNPKVQEGRPPNPSVSVFLSLEGSLQESVPKGRIYQTRKGIVCCVPVITSDRRPLMPTSPKHARKMIASGKATPFWKHGVFCIRLNVEPSDRKVQPIAVGIDPGSKMEGFTVKSHFHTYLNVQVGAVTWVKDAVEARRNQRRSRRNRKTPYRQNKMNRARGNLAPSTKARWQLKLRVLNWLSRLYPISDIVVEDIKAKTKGQKRWDKNFSPLEVGKHWFYEKIRKYGKLVLVQGWETFNMRNALRLKKSKKKLEAVFSAHCVDSWVLANSVVQSPTNKPDNERILSVFPLRFHRRQLHKMVPSKGGKRGLYGGTRSLGMKRGSLVKHSKHGVVYVGGSSNNRISVHSLKTGERLSQKIKIGDCKFLSYNSFRTYET